MWVWILYVTQYIKWAAATADVLLNHYVFTRPENVLSLPTLLLLPGQFYEYSLAKTSNVLRFLVPFGTLFGQKILYLPLSWCSFYFRVGTYLIITSLSSSCDVPWTLWSVCNVPPAPATKCSWQPSLLNSICTVCAWCVNMSLSTMFCWLHALPFLSSQIDTLVLMQMVFSIYPKSWIFAFTAAKLFFTVCVFVCEYLCVSICLLLCLPVDVCGYHEKNAPCVPHAHRAVISLFLVLHSRPWFQFLPLVPYLFSPLYVLSSRVNASLVSSTFSSLNLPLLLVSCLLWFTYFTVSISLHCLQNTFKWDLIVYDFKFIIHSSYCLTLKLRCTQKYLL